MLCNTQKLYITIVYTTDIKLHVILHCSMLSTYFDINTFYHITHVMINTNTVLVFINGANVRLYCIDHI